MRHIPKRICDLISPFFDAGAPSGRFLFPEGIRLAHGDAALFPHFGKPPFAKGLVPGNGVIDHPMGETPEVGEFAAIGQVDAERGRRNSALNFFQIAGELHPFLVRQPPGGVCDAGKNNGFVTKYLMSRKQAVSAAGALNFCSSMKSAGTLRTNGHGNSVVISEPFVKKNSRISPSFPSNMTQEAYFMLAFRAQYVKKPSIPASGAVNI